MAAADATAIMNVRTIGFLSVRTRAAGSAPMCQTRMPGAPAPNVVYVQIIIMAADGISAAKLKKRQLRCVAVL